MYEKKIKYAVAKTHFFSEQFHPQTLQGEKKMEDSDRL